LAQLDRPQPCDVRAIAATQYVDLPPDALDRQIERRFFGSGVAIRNLALDIAPQHLQHELPAAGAAGENELVATMLRRRDILELWQKAP
jgi:hypothetical protein